ncbi:hypothetical protein C8R45DRAFT_1110719 [Mycena sanguinolenta]|nr:hypothetical protein C8R45DRAFT_1110719 [Mycena sanguinolenta]
MALPARWLRPCIRIHLGSHPCTMCVRPSSSGTGGCSSNYVVKGDRFDISKTSATPRHLLHLDPAVPRRCGPRLYLRRALLYFHRYLAFARHVTSKSASLSGNAQAPSALTSSRYLRLMGMVLADEAMTEYRAAVAVGRAVRGVVRISRREKKVRAERLRDFVLPFPNSKTASTIRTDDEDVSKEKSRTYSKPEFTLVLPFVIRHGLSYDSSSSSRSGSHFPPAHEHERTNST